MIYSSADILLAIEEGEIKIVPYDASQLGANSYDVRLGNWFYELFWDKDGPFFVGPYHFKDGEKVIVPVGGTLLGMTKERVLVSGSIVPELRTRSTIRRIGIDVCMAAGFGDIGYSDHWTIELTAFVSDSLFLDILERLDHLLDSFGVSIGLLNRLIKDREARPYLVAGERIAQIVFNQAKTMPDTKYQGQYKAKWPENMIPKKYRDRIVEAKWVSKKQ